MDVNLRTAVVLKNFTLAEPGDFGLTANHLKKSPFAWNGREIFTGDSMPVHLKEWVSKFLGKVLNVEFRNNKLTGDLYLCKNRLDRLRPGLASDLKTNQAEMRIKPHFGEQTMSILPLCLLVPEVREIRINAKSQNDCPPKILLDQEKRIILTDYVVARVGDAGLSRLDLKKYPQSWNGRNIFYGLSGPPTDARGWENRSVGRIFRTVFRNDELKAELHFDPVALQQIHVQLPDLIKSGQIRPKVKLHFGKPEGSGTATPYCLLMESVSLPTINQSNDGPPSVLMSPNKPNPARTERGVPEAPSIIFTRTKEPARSVNKHGIPDPPPALTRKEK